MIQLVYLSTATRPVTSGLPRAICAQASRNNRRDEITGILIADRNQFLQALEGPQVVVEDAFLRIVTDPRHHDLKLLSRRRIAVREFGEWDMQLCTDACHFRVWTERVAQLTRNAPPELREAFGDFVDRTDFQRMSS